MPYHPDALTGPSVGKTSASANTQAPWDPINWKTEHSRMCELHVSGMPVSKIVYEFKRYGVRYTSRHIKRVLESPKGRELCSLMSAQRTGGAAGLLERGASYLPEAVYAEASIMRNPLAGDRHRLNASQDIMDRFGLPKVSRQENDAKLPQTVIINLLPEQLKQFAAPPPAIEARVVELPPSYSTTDSE